MVEQIFLAISYVGLKFKHLFPALAMAFFLQFRVLAKVVGRLALKLSGSTGSLVIRKGAICDIQRFLYR